VELGWESFIDSLKILADGWENYWNDESDLHGLTMSGHYCFGSIRNSGDFSGQDCMLVCKDYCSAMKRSHSSVLETVVELEI